MRLSLPCDALEFTAVDIYGKPFSLSDYAGRPVILSFFRDASCPFCNLRVYEYSQRFKEWDLLGISVIAVFSSEPEAVKEFVAKQPRPFRTVGDPNLDIYNVYGIGSSLVGFFKAIFSKFDIIRAGFRTGAKINVTNSKPFLLPADFLIGPNGKVMDLWYGSDASDHIPMPRIEKFVDKIRMVRLNNARRKKQVRASTEAKLTVKN